ncbi:hypothetical protein QYM36_008650, partial [Artemia franciscana]
MPSQNLALHCNSHPPVNSGKILTQEDWNVVLFNGMEKTTHWSSLYFIALMTFGNYVLFNLLVAILVEGFSAERVERIEREQRNIEKLEAKQGLSEPSHNPQLTEEEKKRQRAHKNEAFMNAISSDLQYEPKCNLEKESLLKGQGLANGWTNQPLIMQTLATPHSSPRCQRLQHLCSLDESNSSVKAPVNASSYNVSSCRGSTVDMRNCVSSPERSRNSSPGKTASDSCGASYKTLEARGCLVRAYSCRSPPGNVKSLRPAIRRASVSPASSVIRPSPRKLSLSPNVVRSNLETDEEKSIDSRGPPSILLNNRVPSNLLSKSGGSSIVVLQRNSLNHDCNNPTLSPQGSIRSRGQSPSKGVLTRQGSLKASGTLSEYSVNKICRYIPLPSFLKERYHFSLYIFPEENNFRRWCAWLVAEKWFDHVILFFIALNCVALAMERPNIPPKSAERYFLTISNDIFTAVFTAECVFK